MDLDTDALNRLMSSAYDRRSTDPAPDRTHLDAFRRKEFSEADLAETFHENTKYTEHTDRSDQSTMSHFVHDETMQYAVSKAPPEYEGRERIDLPAPSETFDVDLSEAVRRRRTVRSYSGDGLSLDRLSTLLYYSCGATGRISAADGVENLGRAYPSGGGLYPVEIYFAVLNGGDDLDEGLYYYVPDDHALRVLERGDDEFADEVAALFATGGLLDPTDAAVAFALTGAFWRSKAKYGPRGYRFALQESGHVVQNVQLVATAMGLASAPFAAARENEVNDFLGVDGVDEAAIYTGFVGVPDARRADHFPEGGSRR
ncbi:SagB/ThcOx family dehydrogenase [Halorussus gelatinilyticus]|uniref:SagB/ThcOx family dehydrogenase n=1 Tax=Halorussus gelatinilyticus TaxID=2937524 RepID=A0A8U0IN48_9EURY|nr:SagB/ThcOx family dehydrogenase [Halorussus gelatinilyticus]UPW02055.1 SagB/ThcOx family dehydrogenase [Halorussus gelatinilyticus]